MAVTIAFVRMAVVDVGSNTVRLLIAGRRGLAVERLSERRAYLRLGDDVERFGWISEAKLRETVETVRAFAREATDKGCHHLEVVVTAPGRRAANGDELVDALAAATAGRVRVLSAEDEGRLAWTGVLVGLDEYPESVAVCDSGGGSTEVVVGTPAKGPVWLRSLDVGSLTVRRLLPDDPPGKAAIRAAREEVAARLDAFAPPLPKAAYATGGTARALRRLVGRTLGPQQLEDALRILAKRPAAEVAAEHRLDPERAWTLAGGAIVLTEVQRRLRVPFVVSSTGMREGVVATVLAELAAA